ncbi:AAA family ATPase [Marinitoga hydrogenitolerans]|uniref:AAA family ATPase n=1 Tax=Marinitoga hydrogenitolerans TaxID=287990 RepID=UPI0022856016|nr:AAA family ATPase [Marinitoga hydrogenitolerans]
MRFCLFTDEYDHFANELLSFNLDLFKDSVTKHGFVRKFYEEIKKGTQTIIERLFMTGVSPGLSKILCKLIIVD